MGNKVINSLVQSPSINTMSPTRSAAVLHFKRLEEVSTLTSAPATANLRDGRGSRVLGGGSRHYSLDSGAVLGNDKMEWG